MTKYASLCLFQPPSQHTCQSPNQEPNVTSVRRRRYFVSIHIFCLSRSTHYSLFGDGMASLLGGHSQGLAAGNFTIFAVAFCRGAFTAAVAVSAGSSSIR